MNKYFSIIAVAASAICFVSCSSEIAEETQNNDKKVAMSFSVGPAETRAKIEDGDLGKKSPSVIWEKDDQITIFEKNHTSGDVFTLTSGTNTNVAWFEGYSYTGTEYYAVYPASKKVTYNGESLSFEIPSSQKAIKGTFDPEGAVQIGLSNASGAIDLGHVTAGLYITFKAGCKISAVSIKPSTNDFALAGTVIATPTDADFNYTYNKYTGDNNKISLSGFPATTEDGDNYVLSVIPSKEVPKFSLNITYYDSKGTSKTLTRRFEASSSFKAGNLYSLGTYYMNNDALTSFNTYTVSCTHGDNGWVAASSTRSEADHEITLTVKPDDGYELDALTVTNASTSDAITYYQVTGTENQYYFTMPAANVTVNATFKATNGEGPDPENSESVNDNPDNNNNG